jgi:serine protease Do
MEISERRSRVAPKAASILFAAMAIIAVGATGTFAGKIKTDPHDDVSDQGSARFLSDEKGPGNVFADVAEKIIPSVVSIYTTRDGEEVARGRRNGREDGLGSGVIVGSDGLILTNNHVIENASTLRVALSDEREFAAEVLAADPAADLAVIRLKGKHGKLSALTLGDSDKLRVGDWVAAVGNPYGLSETVTTGIVSAKGRSAQDMGPAGNFIQTDAAINPGNSGGALVNLKGELVGINTAMLSSKGRGAGGNGIGFAIPSNLARAVMADLLRESETRAKTDPAAKAARGWLGITIQTVDPSLADAMELKSEHGALVTSVTKGGPGDRAGLRRGDVILRLDDAPIRDASGLLGAVATVKPGKEADLTFQRGIKTREVSILIGLRPDAGGEDEKDPVVEPPAARLGLQVAEPDAGLRRRYHTGSGEGVVVLEVEPGSKAQMAGLKRGDFIVEAGNRPVGSPRALQDAVAAGKKKGKLVLRVRRGEEVFFAAVRFG